MKRILVVVVGVIVVLVGVGTFLGYNIIRKISQNASQNTKIAAEVVEDECTELAEEYAALSDALSANSNSEKVSPNSNLTIEKHYKECGHITKANVPIPYELVNKTEEEVKKEYTGWDISKFAKDEVIISKEFEGICDEHYLITEKDGYIAIYTLDQEGKQTLKEITEIQTELLPQYDYNIIKTGIRVFGKHELNAVLEDFE